MKNTKFELKQLEDWCLKTIELLNRMNKPKSDAVELINGAFQKSVHVYTGVENISSALKLPVKIECTDEFYEKSVTHLGITFFQIEHYPQVKKQGTSYTG